MSKDFNRWLQSRLTAHGFAAGPIDGEVGALTKAALRAFEAANGLPVDGTADPKVVRALRATSSAVTPAVAYSLPDRDDDDGAGMPEKSPWPRDREMAKFFGEPGKNQVLVEVPFDMFLSWDTNERYRRVSVHRKVAKSAESCLQKIATTYSAIERHALGIDICGGTLAVRRKRGGRTLSTHAYGAAFDFDPLRNGLNVKAPMSRLSHQDAIPFWEIWEAEGWVSLGRARNFDWMHVQAVRLG